LPHRLASSGIKVTSQAGGSGVSAMRAEEVAVPVDGEDSGGQPGDDGRAAARALL